MRQFCLSLPQKIIMKLERRLRQEKLSRVVCPVTDAISPEISPHAAQSSRGAGRISRCCCTAPDACRCANACPTSSNIPLFISGISTSSQQAPPSSSTRTHQQRLCARVCASQTCRRSCRESNRGKPVQSTPAAYATDMLNRRGQTVLQRAAPVPSRRSQWSAPGQPGARHAAIACNAPWPYLA